MIGCVEFPVIRHPNVTSKKFLADRRSAKAELDAFLSDGFKVISQQPFTSTTGDWLLYVLHKEFGEGAQS